MRTVVLFRTKTDGTSLVNVFNMEDDVLDAKIAIYDAIQTFEENSGRQFTKIEDISDEEFAEHGLYLVKGVIGVMINDNTPSLMNNNINETRSINKTKNAIKGNNIIKALNVPFDQYNDPMYEKVMVDSLDGFRKLIDEITKA